ncbi:MAG: MMPL family transporter, partial [Acidimicrobiales bacterium]
MTFSTTPIAAPRNTLHDDPEPNPGPLGKLGMWSVGHKRTVFLSWMVVIIILGIFAPNVEKALSGAGWQANSTQSVAVRNLAQSDFGGQASSSIEVVVQSSRPLSSMSGQATLHKVEELLTRDHRISKVIAPIPGVTLSADGHTGIVMAGAGADPNTMVRAADDLKGPLAALGSPGTTVTATGASVLWSDFNTANRTAMMKSEMFSWPVTLAILVLAFGSLVAAGLPLLLTMAGLLSAAGMLDLLTKLTPISIWAMNFALMFALALGIDYALFIVVRFRGAHFGRHRDVRHSVAETMDSAGKAVLFSGLTVLISLSSVMVVPSPAFQSMAGGIMLAVTFVLAASLTLLPAVLGKLGDRVDALALPWVHAGEHRSKRFAAWGELLWRRPWAFGAVALVALLALAIPVIGLKTAMPSIKVVPATDASRMGYVQVQKAFGVGAPGQLQIIVPAAEAATARQTLQHDRGIVGVMPTQFSTNGTHLAMLDAVPNVDPSNPALATSIARLRVELPSGSLVGGAPAENYDLQRALSSKTPVVIGLVL